MAALCADAKATAAGTRVVASSGRSFRHPLAATDEALEHPFVILGPASFAGRRIYGSVPAANIKTTTPNAKPNAPVPPT
jgi:hypothetical protein